MPITQFTDHPRRGDPAFAAKAEDWNGRQLPRFVGEMNNAIVEVNRDATEAALAAAYSEASASMAVAATEGLANFRGDWSGLSGPLSMPASVRHNGRFWLLTGALPNVALSEPGVDVSKWQPVRRGAIVTAASVQAQAGDDIVSTAATAITVTLPAGPSAGDTVSIVRMGAGLVTVARNGSTILNVADNLALDRQHWRLTLVYAGGTWRISLEGLTA